MTTADAGVNRHAFSPRFALLLLASTCATVAAGAVAPVLPRFVESSLGGSHGVVGVVVALSPLCSLVGTLAAGPQVDRLGRRWIAVAGLSVAVVGALLLLVAHSVAVTSAARIVSGIGGGFAFAATITWAVDLASPDRRGRAIGLYGLTVWVGLSIGPQLGQAVADAEGFRGVWVLVAALEVATLLLVLCLGPDRAPRMPRPRLPLVHQLFPKGARRPCALIALAAYGEGVIAAFLVLHLIHHGVRSGAGFGGAASVFTIFAASVFALRLFAAQVVDRAPPERVALAGFAAESAGLVVLAVAASFGVAAVGACLMGCGFAVLFPALALAATEATAEEERGAALGSFGASYSFGVAAGSLLGGVVAELWGTGAAHISAAVAASVAGAITARSVAEPAVRAPR